MMVSIASIAIAFTLVVVTYLYMRYTKRLADETKRMANIMVKGFELKIAPIIQIEKRDGSFHGNFGSRNSEIINKGSLPAHIAKIVLEWWYEELPDKVYRKEEIIDKVLGEGEPRKFAITVNKSDMLKDDFEKSKNLGLNQLLGLSKARIYATYIDRNGNEYKTRDFSLERPF